MDYKLSIMGSFIKYGIGLTLGLSLSAGGLRAQSVSQLLTQLSLDIQKLSELKTILNDMYKSYTILDKGYTDIKNIAQGNFSLHKAYLDGLLAVSPTISGYYKVAGIISTEISIVSEYKEAYRQWTANGHFTLAELNYINQVYAGLFNQGLRHLGALTMVLTADQLRMSDADRLASIDRIYSDITGQLGSLRSFNNGLSVQEVQRAKEQNDINTLKSVYGNSN
jgi:hypothetical protein